MPVGSKDTVFKWSFALTAPWRDEMTGWRLKERGKTAVLFRLGKAYYIIDIIEP
jgi:hypothetical protein